MKTGLIIRENLKQFMISSAVNVRSQEMKGHCLIRIYFSSEAIKDGIKATYLVQSVGVGGEVKDRSCSTTMSWREKSPPKVMSPFFSSIGRDMVLGSK